MKSVPSLFHALPARMLAVAIGVAGVIAPMPAPALAASPSTNAESEIKVRFGPFDPLAGAPIAPKRLLLTPSESRSSSVRIIQFRSIPGQALRQQIESFGASVLTYLPDNAYVVRIATSDLAKIRALPDHRWDGAVEPAWKIAPDLGTRPLSKRSRGARGEMLAIIELWPDADADRTASRLDGDGLEVRAVWRNDGLERLLVYAPRTALERAARLDDVSFIEEAPEAVMRNDGATWVVQSNVTDFRPIWDYGLRGENQVLGIIDGRIDMNSCYFDDGGASPGPSHRKVIAYRSSNGLGADSHGTHVAGTMAGDSGTYGAWDTGDGHAFAAKLSFSNLDDVTGSGTAPSNLMDRLVSAHQDGARAHSNSWGDDGTTSYTTWSRDIDDFSWQYEDSLVLFAVTNGSKLRTPENAKNVLAVGATEREGNADTHCSGGEGPTSDGRRKPEIYAPGCSTISAASGQSCGTRSMTGTSMASPAVAGAAALVRQYFVEGWYPSGTPIASDSLTPSGALMKATLISGALDMTAVAGYPSNLEGWGRVHLERSLYFSDDSRGLVVLDDVRRADGLQAGEQVVYQLNVEDGSEELRITMAFTEPPAAVMAAEATINNLDLKVEAPDGTVYWGNRTDGNGESVADGSPDAINNLEQVLFTSPATGTWVITVIADAVPEGPQGYALVATGGVRPASGPRLKTEGFRIQDTAPLGNEDEISDPGETFTMPVTLANRGSDPASAVSGRLTVNRSEWVRVLRDDAQWPDLAAGTSSESLAPHYEMTVLPNAPCGERVRMSIEVNAAELESSQINYLTLDIGDPRTEQQGPAREIPAYFLGQINSPLEVTEEGFVREVDVTVDITHGDISELMVILVSPDQTQVVLHNRTMPGQADMLTRFDLERAPDGPGTMNDFVGEAMQGPWGLLISDNRATPIPPGRLNGWTLHLTADRALTCTPLSCADPTPTEEVRALLISKNGADLDFQWDAEPSASGYHIVESAQPTMSEVVLTGRTSGETSFTLVGGASATPQITYFQVRAINSCNWEGP